MAHHVADHERHPAVGARRARRTSRRRSRFRAAGQVARGELQALDARQALGQEAALERLGDRVLALVDLAQAGLHGLALVDVDRRAHVPGEAPAHVTWNATVDDPAVVALPAAQAVLVFPRLAAGKPLVPGGESGRGVLGVYAARPGVAELLFQRCAGIARASPR